MRELDCGPAPDPFDALGQPKLSAFAGSSTASAVSEAAKALSQGFLVAFPTETVYEGRARDIRIHGASLPSSSPEAAGACGHGTGRDRSRR